MVLAFMSRFRPTRDLLEDVTSSIEVLRHPQIPVCLEVIIGEALGVLRQRSAWLNRECVDREVRRRRVSFNDCPHGAFEILRSLAGSSVDEVDAPRGKSRIADR